MPEVIFGIIAIVATALYVREYAVRRKIEKDSKPQPGDQANALTIAQLTAKSSQLVQNTEANAQKLVEEAKLFDEKATQDFAAKLNVLLDEEGKQTKQASEQVVADFKAQEEKFDKFLRDLSESFETKTTASLASFKNYLETLEKQSQSAQATNWEGMKTTVAELFENFETKLADFLLQTEQKMMLSVDLELKSARQLIDTYKVQQMNIIDENIVSMLEKTLSMVLAKNLNLKDQMELVYESLEKAKTESFLS